jgi:YegS/Rv2252/BmrU family lipid kinase
LAHRASLLGLTGETLFSERPGHLIELAREAVAGGATRVVAAGGDGTLNEVVNGVAGSGVELATIPLGTGMDFGRTYGIPTKFDDAVRVALDGEVRTIDAGRVSYRTWSGEDAERWFANVGSVGMSGAVAQRANGMSKALGGKVTFFYALTRVFFEWQNTEVTVQLDDGERRGRMHDVVIANGVWHGGGMKLAPDASPSDGLFDVVFIGDVGKVDFLTTAPKIYKGKHVHHPKVEVVRSARVAVDAEEHLPIEVEGEQVGTTPATFEIAPGALRVRVPRGV